MPNAVVERPDSVTHFECESPRAPKQNVGTPEERRVTHTMIGGRCMYCRRTRSDIAREAGIA